MQAAINPQNFSYPNQRFIQFYNTMLSPSMLKSGIIKLNHLHVIDDDGWLYETKNVKKFIQAERASENFNIGNDSRGYLFSGVFELGQVNTTYQRQYTRLQTVLAQIQGSAATVILVLIIILRPYSQLKFQEVLVNELFDVKMKKKDGNINKKDHGNITPKKKSAKPKPKTLLQEKSTAGISPGVDSGLSKMTSQEVTEGNRLFSIASDRPLISPRGKTEEKDGEKLLTTRLQSFKTLFNSIDNDSPSPPILPQSVEKRTFFEQPSPDTLRKSTNPGQSLRIDKPGKIKLMALSDMVSDGPDSPRNVSELSVKEEEDRKSAPAENNPLQLSLPALSPQNGAEMIALEVAELKENNEKQVEQDEEVNQPEDEDESETQDEENLNYESTKIDISIWEFFASYVKKSKQTKEKFEVLDKGMKNVKERMDILNIMKKFRELDKLKALLLEEDQLILFNAMPKAQIRPGDSEITTNELMKKRSFSQRILKKSTFIEMKGNQELTKAAYENLRVKAKKSKIDTRLLEFYENMLLNKNQFAR